MHLTFSPIVAQGRLMVHQAADRLVLNGQAFDFSDLPEGGWLPRAAVGCDWLASDVTRKAGRLRLTLILPHGADAPREVRFPAPMTLDNPGEELVPLVAPGLACPAPMEPQAIRPGIIDWTSMIPPELAEAEARQIWRTNRTLPKPDLLLALLATGLICEDSAMGMGLPPEFTLALADLPAASQAELRIRWAHLSEVPRLHPVVLALQAAHGWTDASTDALFGWPA